MTGIKNEKGKHNMYLVLSEKLVSEKQSLNFE